jgi:HD superfamily phosphohydrolase
LGLCPALEAFVIARIESFKSIYFPVSGKLPQIMLSNCHGKKPMKNSFNSFKTPEEYLAIDDYTIWGALRKCRASNEIINNLENRRMLKCAYERTFYEKDDMISELFRQESYRNKIRGEIAKAAGVGLDAVIIDVPTVPSVPYHHAVLMGSTELPVFTRSPAGEKKLQRLSESSKIFETLKGFMNILRVYTDAENRTRVEKATSKVLGKIPSTEKISF